MIIQQSRQLLRKLLAICVIFSTGCQTMSIVSPSRLFEDEPEFVTPTKLIPVWSDTVLHQAGRKGQRGCGGRVMFYAGDGKRAVRVDGSMVVYAWNDSLHDRQRKPDRKFAFPMDDFQKHYSTSSIGESYSFWLPWDDTGGNQTELTIVARFVGRNGAEITSAPARVILPGEITEPENTRTSRTSEPTVKENSVRKLRPIEQADIVQVGFEQERPEAGHDAPRLRTSMTTAEIPLTAGFLKRNLSKRPQPFSANDLFAEPSVQESEPASVSQHPGHSTGVPSENPTSTLPASEQIPLTRPPEDRSLQFRHKVQTKRAAQRSVGRALSQQYQSGLRNVPWQRD